MSRPHLQKSIVQKAFTRMRGAFVSAGVFSFFINLLMLTGPLFMLQIYDRVLASHSIPTLVALLVLVAALFCFMGFLEYVRSRILIRAGVGIDQSLGRTSFDSVLDHAVRRTPNVRAVPLKDLDTIRQFLSGPGPFSLFDAPWVPVYILVIFLFHPILGLFALLGAIVLFALALLNNALTSTPLGRANASINAAHHFAEESRRNAEAVRAMGMRQATKMHWSVLRDKSLSDHTAASDRAGSITAFTKSLRMFLQSAMLGLGAYLAVKQAITPGTMIAASIVLSRALAPVEQAITHWRGFVGFRRARARLGVVLDDAIARQPPLQLPVPQGRLTAENVIVLAPGKSVPLLQGVNFQLDPGQAMGVIGPTGAGKSSLARTLVGVWPAAKGNICIDGAPLTQWDPDQLGGYIGYLPQTVELFAGSVEQNIARFARDAEPDAIVSAAREAGVHELILSLPDGYKTMIGEGGAALSGGQRQRIAMARALFGDPVIVVLDEPNANLDLAGDEALAATIQSLKRRQRTVVVVAHRPSAITAVDKLLFLQGGHQIAFGDKDEVLSKVLKNQPDPSAQVASARRQHA